MYGITIDPEEGVKWILFDTPSWYAYTDGFFCFAVGNEPREENVLIGPLALLEWKDA